MSLDNLNYIELTEEVQGNERKIDILKEPLENGGFLPNTVKYDDIDNSFKTWADEKLKIVSDDGVLFPTMTLYSNQRFSEYLQSWEYTDSNNNLILNFKTVTRENNPQYGKIQNGYYNIPCDIFFLMKRKLVLDDNGTESLLDLKMKQPMSIDIIYKLTVFTNKYEKINEFNLLVNNLFKSRQTYIQPNGYYMPMVLESINDKSQYQIDDRQFYSQTYMIKVMGFVITEDDFRIEEKPLKKGLSINGAPRFKRPEVEIEECNPTSPYYYKPIILTITFPVCKETSVKFTIDVDFVCTNVELIHVKNNFRIFVNGDEIDKENGFSFKKNDEVKVMIKKNVVDLDSILILNGYNPNIVYDENIDEQENSLENSQYTDIYEYKS